MKADTFDIRNQPAYVLAEAARYVGLPAPTLRSWMVGRADRSTARPLILIEAHVLRSLRTAHEVSMPDLRKAIAYAEKEFHIERLLLRNELRTSAGELFLDRYG